MRHTYKTYIISTTKIILRLKIISKFLTEIETFIIVAVRQLPIRGARTAGAAAPAALKAQGQPVALFLNSKEADMKKLLLLCLD